MTSAPGSSANASPGRTSFDLRTPDPTTTSPADTTAVSTRIGHAGGRPIGAMPPYSMPVSATATSIGANDALRASNLRRTTPFTSARVVASTMHAAIVVTSPRRPATTTQFADAPGATSYAAQKAAVSASSASISATPTSPARGHDARNAATAGASRSGRSSAGTAASLPMRNPLLNARSSSPQGW